MKIAFLTDSGCGKSIKEMAALGINSVPLQLIIGEDNYRDIEDIEISDAYQKMGEGKLLSTSLPSIGEMEALFTKLKAEGYTTIFAVPICSGLSGTLQSMHLCAQHVGIEFEYMESYVTAVLQEYLIVNAFNLYQNEHLSISEIRERLVDVVHSANTLLLPNDLQHLKRSGRLTPIAATLGGLLKIKPILHINEQTNGKVDVFDKVRTMSKAMDKCVDLMLKSGVNEQYSITIAHAEDDENAHVFADKVSAAFPKNEINIIKLVSVVGVHTGRGCQGIQYFKKIK